MNWEWINISFNELFMILLTGIFVFAALLLFIRISGLRSFSKMSGFDFATTVAFGSIMASALLSKTPSILAAIFALGVLFTIQFVISKLRRSSKAVRKLLDNEPMLLMARDKILSENLNHARMTHDDLLYKLREHGITHKKQVLAVVLETTGDVSVLKACDNFDIAMLDGVRDSEQMTDYNKNSKEKSNAA